MQQTLLTLHLKHTEAYVCTNNTYHPKTESVTTCETDVKSNKVFTA